MAAVLIPMSIPINNLKRILQRKLQSQALFCMLGYHHKLYNVSIFEWHIDNVMNDIYSWCVLQLQASDEKNTRFFSLPEREREHTKKWWVDQLSILWLLLSSLWSAASLSLCALTIGILNTRNYFVCPVRLQWDKHYTTSALSSKSGKKEEAKLCCVSVFVID